MDPDKTLESMRENIRIWLGDPDSDAGRQAAAWASEAADSLDQWLSKGGFLPKDWSR